MDEREFRAVLDRHEGRLRALIQQRLSPGDGLDADDLAQEVRIRLWRALATEKGVTHLASYIQKIVFSVFIDALRRRDARKEQGLDEVMSAELENAHERPEAEPEQLASRQHQTVLVQQALASIQASRRMPAQLLLHGFNPAEIATMLNLTDASARNLAYRGVEDLKQALNALGMEHVDD
ncbi:RNA polymerase sigma factor [Ahniella affigens]|uniref:RNA polymerase sigma factor n=1 Tax=Ahniella affigens TaxID=2021234 RepID=UPI001476642C|nr:RNA polymerase sigma factor [Ahniella affigens]